MTQHRLVCSDIKIMKRKRKSKREGVKKIKRWKLKDGSVKREFEKSYEKRSESLMQSDKTQQEKTYENSMETGKEICSVGKAHTILE